MLIKLMPTDVEALRAIRESRWLCSQNAVACFSPKMRIGRCSLSDAAKVVSETNIKIARGKRNWVPVGSRSRSDIRQR